MMNSQTERLNVTQPNQIERFAKGESWFALVGGCLFAGCGMAVLLIGYGTSATWYQLGFGILWAAMGVILVGYSASGKVAQNVYQAIDIQALKAASQYRRRRSLLMLGILAGLILTTFVKGDRIELTTAGMIQLCQLVLFSYGSAYYFWPSHQLQLLNTRT